VDSICRLEVETENWRNHVQCMTENKITRQMVDCKLQGIKSYG
jgi:hypothetical protein